MARQIRRLLWPFLGMLVVSVALQAISLVAVLEIDARVARSQQQVEAAASQHVTVEQFENSTYLALVGLATSDWEMLLQQRTSAQELVDRFTSMNTAMLQGGRVSLGDREVSLEAVDDPQARAAIATIPELWNRVYRTHVRVLRSENRSLKHNPDLEEFRVASRELTEALDQVTSLIQNGVYEETGRLSQIQRVIPVGAFLLTLALFGFVFARILLPFAASTEELERSEAELRRARDVLEQRVAERTADLAQAIEALRHSHDDLEERVRERTQDLKEAQRRAVELARQAGMAELATNVLHNVGNVLNSINTASSMLGEHLQSLRVAPLIKLTEVFEEHRANLAAFMMNDERGRRLPEYLGKLGQHLSAERKEMLEMTADLQRHVEHVRMIVEMQQSYAMSSSIVEAASLEELVEDALRISAAALGRHGVSIERESISLPRLMLDRHRVLQIILNLISNAKYAVNGNPEGARRIAVKIDRPAEDRIRVRVSDNGMGIAPELLTKIFQHGFTTRKDGHGFGLHSCAIAARALGGSLVAQSDGPSQGAAFTLELPYQPEAANNPQPAN